MVESAKENKWPANWVIRGMRWPFPARARARASPDVKDWAVPRGTSDQLTQIALLVLFQKAVAAQSIPITGRRGAVQRILVELGLSTRMRKYWREHADAKKAWAVIGSLAPNPERDTEGSGLPAYEHTALSALNAAVGTDKEKEAVQARALILWDKYKTGALRERALDDKRLPGVAEGPQGDFRDAIED